MIECDGCGKRHRSKERVIACRLRRDRRDERAKAKAEDAARRSRNAHLYPVRDRIAQLRQQGMAWVNLAAAVRRDYPQPGAYDHGCRQSLCPACMRDEWDVIACLGIDSERFEWPMTERQSTLILSQLELFSKEEVIEKLPWRKQADRYPGGQPVVWPSVLAEVTEEEEYIEDVD